ncbi:hypothetical protein, conserved [Eimeria necatrix]|uniref:Uncharacterized protein n=1 Tax=Eimeria necatrix TaxID=51315 RepID=U6MZV0_9EIME|nr:hypothetical protein, conserved [Eimeria necatrix]CDJ69763.1 hypothetical protein, conserved [Eimeria necatrix]
MNHKHRGLALVSMEAGGPMAGRKLGVLQEREGGGATSRELLMLPNIGAACCSSSSCSSSSSPAATDEPAEDWTSTDILLENPIASEYRTCYCCLGTGCSRCQTNNNGTINSSKNTSRGIRGSFKWWDDKSGAGNSSCSNLGKCTDEIDCTTICTVSSPIDVQRSSIIEHSSRTVKFSSSPGDSSNNTHGSNTSEGLDSREYKWRGCLKLLLKRVVERDGTGNSRSSSSKSESNYNGLQEPGIASSATKEQQGAALNDLVTETPKLASGAQDASCRAVSLSKSPLRGIGRCLQEHPRKEGPHESDVDKHGAAVGAAVAGASETGAAPAIEHHQHQQKALLRTTEGHSSVVKLMPSSDKCRSDSTRYDLKQHFTPSPVGHGSSNIPAALTSVSAADPQPITGTPRPAVATPTATDSTQSSEAETSRAALLVSTERPRAAATPVVVVAPARRAAAATPTAAESAASATVSPSLPSRACFSTAACQHGLPSFEPRLCYCLEHLLAGLCWGHHCICGSLQDCVLWGSGVCRRVDSHLVNPQQELELLLQHAALASPAAAEGSPQLAATKKVSDVSGRQRAFVPQQLSYWGPHSPVQGRPWIPSSVSPLLLSSSRSAEGRTQASASGSFSGAEETDGQFPRKGRHLPSFSEPHISISDWGDPAHQWVAPLRTDFEAMDSSSTTSSISCRTNKASPGDWVPFKKNGISGTNCVGEDKEDIQKPVGVLAPLLGFGQPLRAGSAAVNRYPRTALSADSFVSSGAQWFGSSEDEAGESGTEGSGRPLMPRSSCSPRFCSRKALEGSKIYNGELRRRTEGLIRERDRVVDEHRTSRDPRQTILLASTNRATGTNFSVRPNSHQRAHSPSGGPCSGHEDIWGDVRESDCTTRATGAIESDSNSGGSRWKEAGRDATGSNNNHQAVLEIAAVPVRTRKGFRKPLPLPPEMLAAIASAGPRRPVDPVLQYDGESREWRVFWMEEPQARYKVFQSKKFGKERAQQLALEWLHRAKAGAIHGSGRGPRVGGPSAYRFKRGRHEGLHLATEYKHGSPETLHLSTPQSGLELSPEGSPALAPFPTAIADL